MSLRRISRPTGPPSPSSSSVDEEEVDGAGDTGREGSGDVTTLLLTETFAETPFEWPFVFNNPFFCSSFAAFDRLSMLPVPNLLHGWPGFVRCLFSWNIRKPSDWWFFLFSEWTALSSRAVHDGEKSGLWKNGANRDSPSRRAEGATLK